MKKYKKNICMFGAFSGNNRGDFAILETIVKNIKDFSNNIYISSKKPLIIKNELGNIYNVKSFKTFTSYIGINSLYYIYKSDIITIGGGGLFFERKFFNIFFNHIIGIFFIVLIAKLFKKEVYIFSVGAEKIYKKIPKYFMKFILKNSNCISVRDKDSKNALKMIYNKNYKLFYDPVLSNEFNIDNTKKGVLVIINKSIIEDKGLLKLITLLKNMNLQITLFENERTQKLVEDFIKNNNLGKNVSYLKNSRLKNTFNSIDYISHFALTISAPMHGLIFSYIGRTPFIAIGWNEKVKSFIDIIDNNYYLFNSFGEIKKEHIISTISNKINESNYENIRNISQKGINYFIKNFLK